MSDPLLGSVVRISDLNEREYDWTKIPQDGWKTGDYVVGRIVSRPGPEARIESPTGRKIEPLEGELVLGAFGTRRATRGTVGDWRKIEDDGRMQVIGGGGIIGKATSKSPYEPELIQLQYEGHVTVGDGTVNMDDYSLEGHYLDFDLPVVALIGTSMSSGKTMSARVVTRALVEMGYTVGACKLTGSGHYHDTLTMRDAGAEVIYDFVDLGLPTTVVDPDYFEAKLDDILTTLQYHEPDVLVAEVGASPLEPYNGDIAFDRIEDHTVFTVLCASDPYAVVGIQTAYGKEPDLVSGIATNTEAGIDLVEELADVKAVNLMEESEKGILKDRLREQLKE